MKYVYILSFLLFFSCSSENNRSSEATQNKETYSQQKQLNITILLDLSDRIDIKISPAKPEHYERDISIVKYFSEYFIKEMERKGTYMSKGKIKVIFSPKPQDPNVNLFAEKLNVDLSTSDINQKKEIHDNLVQTFTDNVTQIYKSTLKDNKWLGSDIWRFFKNDVKDYCVEKDTAYRNILVILTDGYVYHNDSKDQIGNRYAYILPQLLNQYKLRNNSNWEDKIKKSDFGLITKRSDLENLEVLILEVTPSPSNKDDDDVIKYILSKWFNEMKVKRAGIFNSDLPEYTKQKINNFIKVK